MQILHVIGSLAPRYGGPSVACPALCRELARRGHEVSILTTDVDGERRLVTFPVENPSENFELRILPGWTVPREYKFSPALWNALRERVPSADVVHIYSLYIFSATAAAYFCRRHRIPYVLHPHGTLDPFLLRRHSLRKHIYTQLVERRNFSHAAVILFNSTEEARLAQPWLARYARNGASQSPALHVVPVGVDDAWFTPPLPTAVRGLLERFPELSNKRIVLFYGRLSFKKGIDILAEAFIHVARQVDKAHLLVAGPDTEGLGELLRSRLQVAGLQQKATLTGTLTGQDRLAAMHLGQMLVLPSHSENFGQSVAEALAAGKPVVVSEHVNIWPQVMRAAAGLVVPCDAKQLAVAVRQLLEDPTRAKAMGARGSQWASAELSWRAVGEKMVALYESAAGLSRTPTAMSAGSLGGNRVG